MTRARVQIKGDIITNDDKWIYDWLGWESTCPRDIQGAIGLLGDGEELVVEINSGGGIVTAGQEIYSLLRGCPTSRAEIQGLAGSAAGVAAMGAHHVTISPVGMIMVHNAAVCGANGDCNAMDRYARMLREVNEALATAYTMKSGKPRDEILEMMDRETWITAEQALGYGFVDGITPASPETYVDGLTGLRLTDDIRQRVLYEKAQEDEEKALLRSLGRYLDIGGIK